MLARRFVLPLFALGLIGAAASTAEANNRWPWMWYQPYGLQTGSATRTPPHFAVHPPVYYGSRYARPYGISPFATMPQVTAPEAYQGRLHSDSVPRVCPHCAEQLPKAPAEVHATTERTAAASGPVRTNPYVDDEVRVADGI